MITSNDQTPRRRAAWIIAAVTFLAFARCLTGELVYDDHLLVGRNPLIADITRIAELFSGSYWDFLDPQAAQHVGYYRPLSMLALTLVYRLGDAAPWAFHLASILAHIGASLGAWAVARRLLASERAALWAAILFSLHPVHLESVAWISDLSDPLAMCFGLPCLALLLTKPTDPRPRPWLVAALFLGALLCKESALGLFPVALVLGLIAREPAERTPHRAYLPLFAAAAAWYAIRVAVFGDLLAGFDRTTTGFGVDTARLLQLRVELLGGAAHLLALPLELNLFRAFTPELPVASAAFLWTAAWAALLLGGAHMAHRRGAILPAALGLLIPAALLPVLLRIESVGTFPLSDRFLYLAALTPALLAAHLACKRLAQRTATIALSLLALGYAAQDFTHARAWSNDETLFRAALEQNPRNPNVYWSLGRVLLTKFQDTSQLAHLEEATKLYEDGMLLLGEARDSDFSVFASEDDTIQMNLGLGWCLIYAAESDTFRDFQTPAVIFQRVIDELDRVRDLRGVDPNSANRSLAHTGLGVAYMGAGRSLEASQSFRRAIDTNPRSVEAQFNMGLLLLRKSLPEQAVDHLEIALEYRPRHLRYMVALAVCLERSGQNERARVLATFAMDYHPDSPGPKAILGTLAAKRRDFDSAERWLTESLRANSANGPALLELAQIYLAQDRAGDALPLLEDACRRMPDRFDAHYNLGILRYEAGDHVRATPSLLNAFRLRSVGSVVGKLEELMETFRSDDTHVQWALAAIEYDRRSFNEALRFAQRALDLDASHGPSHYLMGQLLARADELEIALEHFRAACEGLPDDFQVHADCGVAHASYDQGELARPYLQRAIELLPSQGFDPGYRDAAEQRIREALDGIREGG